MSLGLQSAAKVTDKQSGLASPSYQGWFQKLDNALILLGSITAGDIIVSDGGNYVVGGGPLPIQLSTVTLTDAQIKALPTTPITILSAPGSGFQRVPLIVNVTAKFSGGAYTNIDLDSLMYLDYADGTPWSNLLGNDSVIGFTTLTQAIGVAHRTRWQFVGYTDAEPAFTWGNRVSSDTLTDPNNQSVRILMNNNGAGVLTGGNPANTLTLQIYAGLVAV